MKLLQAGTEALPPWNPYKLQQGRSKATHSSVSSQAGGKHANLLFSNGAMRLVKKFVKADMKGQHTFGKISAMVRLL